MNHGLNRRTIDLKNLVEAINRRVTRDIFQESSPIRRPLNTGYHLFIQTKDLLKAAGYSEEFIESIPARPNRYRHATGNLARQQEMGRMMFERSYDNKGRYIPVANRCVTCHPKPYGTDRRKHDVATRAYHDRDGRFDTPHLINVYERPPYLHDGRCYSLEEIWTEFNPDDMHGVSNDMMKEELNALIGGNPDLARRVVIDLADGLASAKLLIPIPEDFPVMAGRNLRVHAGLELRLTDEHRPLVMIRGVSIMGVPIPNAWLGNLKHVDLVAESGDAGFWKAFADGVEDLQVRDGELYIKLRE